MLGYEVSAMNTGALWRVKLIERTFSAAQAALIVLGLLSQRAPPFFILTWKSHAFDLHVDV
jgi:hypothetical protein